VSLPYHNFFHFLIVLCVHPLPPSLSLPLSLVPLLIIRWCAQWRARRGVGGSHGAM
jgi:hypothetical protein